ncbi:MAG TPA: TIR domain-containing protein [Pyrinomonadaceae bacterium]|jgi:hypothetical protein
MSDICLCYANEDREKAVKLAALFRGEGRWSVAFAIPFEGLTAAEVRLAAGLIEDAKVVVLLWSKAGRESASLREQRKRANRHSTFAVLLDRAEPPPGEETRGLVDLSGWDGSEDLRAGLQRPSAIQPQLRALLIAVGQLIQWAGNARPAATVSHPPANTAPPRRAKESAPEPAERPAPAVDSSQARGPRVALGRARRPRSDSAEPAAPPSAPENAGGQGFGGVFISYRRSEGAAYAGRLYDRLAPRFGKEQVFIDTENVGWGEDFVEVITEAAKSCAVMIVLISRGWARGHDARTAQPDYVRLEVATALARKIRLVPILIQGASMPAPEELPEDLSPLLRRNALALSDARWERDVEDLIQTLENILKD